MSIQGVFTGVVRGRAVVQGRAHKLDRGSYTPYQYIFKSRTDGLLRGGPRRHRPLRMGGRRVGNGRMAFRERCGRMGRAVASLAVSPGAVGRRRVRASVRSDRRVAGGQGGAGGAVRADRRMPGRQGRVGGGSRTRARRMGRVGRLSGRRGLGERRRREQDDAGSGERRRGESHRIGLHLGTGEIGSDIYSHRVYFGTRQRLAAPDFGLLPRSIFCRRGQPRARRRDGIS